MDAPSAIRRFRSSSLMERLWSETKPDALDPFFVLRQTRYLSTAKGSNWLAELDLYVRHSSLRLPVLEVLNSDPFRLSIAERIAGASPALSAQALPDLVAGALAERDFGRATQLLEDERSHRTADRNSLLLLTYAYCLSGNVEKAEAVAADIPSGQEDQLASWLWGTLQAEFGFRPPR